MELKGLIAGPVNVGVGILAGATISVSSIWLLAGIIGFFGYGVSLTLYVIALRHLGAARTGAYFSTAPFLGAAISVLALGDALTPRLFVAGGLLWRLAFGSILPSITSTRIPMSERRTCIRTSMTSTTSMNIGQKIR